MKPYDRILKAAMETVGPQPDWPEDQVVITRTAMGGWWGRVKGVSTKATWRGLPKHPDYDKWHERLETEAKRLIKDDAEIKAAFASLLARAKQLNQRTPSNKGRWIFFNQTGFSAEQVSVILEKPIGHVSPTSGIPIIAKRQ